MTDRRNRADLIDTDALEADLTSIEVVADNLRVAAHGLADPLVNARAGQMAREIARLKRTRGENDPEVAAREANLERATIRFALLAEERDRAQVSRPAFDPNQGTVWGRVTDDGVPREDLTISAQTPDGKRLGYTCTDVHGGFALSLAVNCPYCLSVRTAAGDELHRDPGADSLAAGQQLFREIDLARGAEVPCVDPSDEPPSQPEPREGFVMRLLRALNIFRSRRD